ncbi:50S ribosomal protein L24 [Patescibacteria group bacterium]|nr:50S ribosomal protein L24 [Patescibacteria group bacterium]MCL5010560.1 50S ribosomal protein L24 [Patescibacteria group bacterium]
MNRLKAAKIRKGDEVKIMTGKDRGRTGKVEKVLTKAGKIIVAGANQYKRHLKARSQNQPSEIITLVKPISIANVSLICPKCSLPTRVGFLLERNKKIRVCKKCATRISASI